MADTTDMQTQEATETAAVDALVAESVAAAPVDDSVLGDAGEDAPAEQKAEAEAPVLPEKYELTAPEGMTLDIEALAIADPVFRELGLTNDQAQKLMPVAGEYAQRIANGTLQAIHDQRVADRAEMVKAAKADPEIGGAKWDESISFAALALDKLGMPKGSPFREFLRSEDLDNHPEMIRAMVKIGRALSEDTDFVRGDTAAPVANLAHQIYPNNAPKGQ
jgi:hypothetical protein